LRIKDLMCVKAILTIGVVAGVLFLSTPDSHAQQTRIEGLTGSAKRGEPLYQRYCVFCHGSRGDGRGENAAYLNPKPRDLTAGTFICRSTPAGSLPLDSDLYDTISRGINSSGMPSWKPLTRQQRTDLVAYIKSFSPRFSNEKPAAALPIPDEPPSSADSVKRGAQLFQSMNCWSCHGKEGRGNGPAALSLTDNKGFPISPFDFTSGTRFKCGQSGRELFRDLMTGLDGTPMPSFREAMKPEQLWDLVHYLETLPAGGEKGAGEAKTEPKGD
jgi:mono/diheme cytochrome c family protein